MAKEKMINVPLEPDAKAALTKIARANGRAVGRQAAQFIKAAIAADSEKRSA